jgi:hypothetical protein
VAPIVAGVALGLAAVSRWTGWTGSLALAILGFGFAGLIAYAIARRRGRTVTDTEAAALDRDAGLGGELRSAAWFAGLADRDVWSSFHLDRAAARLQAVNWGARYPAPRTGRLKLATGILVLAAIGLSFMTIRAGGPAPGSTEVGPVPGRLPPRGQPLPAELQKQLAELLAAAESGAASSQGLAASAELREFLARLAALADPATLKDLAHAMDSSSGASSDQTLQELMALAERTRRASQTPAVPPEIRSELEKLADKLSIVASDEQAAAQDPDSDANPQPGELAEGSGQTETDTAESIQALKESDAGEGAGVMMMADQDSPGGAGQPGLGSGGGSAGENGGGARPAVTEAMLQETVEASADGPGQNVLTETRRKTEHGRATVTYTQGAPGAFDRSRAAAPPPVPEGRRSAVQTYFIRKP